MKALSLDLRPPTQQDAMPALANPISVPAHSDDPATDAIVSACTGAVVWRPDDGAPPESTRLPTQAELELLGQRRARLAVSARGCVSDADKRKAAVAIAEMLDGFLRARALDKQAKQAMVAGFVTDLQALPAWAIVRACERVRRGEVDGMSLDFLPTSPRLFQIAAAELVPLRNEERRIGETLRLLPVGGMSSEERARVAEKAKAWLERSDPKARALADAAAPLAVTTTEVETANKRMFARMCEAEGMPAGVASPALLRKIAAERPETP